MRSLIASIITLAALAAPAHGVCPKKQFLLDLKTCQTKGLAGVSFVEACGAAAVTASCPAAGWKEAVLRIALPNDCSETRVTVEYDGLPKGWSFNLGDSPTNNGFAGDSGSTANNAEVWILEENLSVANGADNPVPIDNPLALAHLALTNGALQFLVKDQFVSWGNPYGFVQAPASQNLFSVPPANQAQEAEDRVLYLGLNRVISGPGDRTGCGARRVHVSYR